MLLREFGIHPKLLRINNGVVRGYERNDFEDALEKAIKPMVDNTNFKWGDNKPLIRSTLKRHVQLLVYTRLDRIIKRLVP
jgi:hypothetical protein